MRSRVAYIVRADLKPFMLCAIGNVIMRNDLKPSICKLIKHHAVRDDLKLNVVVNSGFETGL